MKIPRGCVPAVMNILQEADCDSEGVTDAQNSGKEADKPSNTCNIPATRSWNLLINMQNGAQVLSFLNNLKNN